MRLDLGAKVCCSDGDLGELADIVIDPTTRKVTHVVVDPEHEMYTPRLVPIALVRPGDGELLELDCTLEQVRDLEQAEEVAYLRLGEFPVDDPAWDVQVTGMLALPYYQSLDMPTGGVYAYDEGVDVLYQRVPKGEVEIQRRSPVTSSDGHGLGHVDGLVVEDDQIAHLVLEHGHLWGRREIVIPIGAVDSVDSEGVTLTLTKGEVEALGPVRVHRWF
jgi:hypothetical protein